MRRKLNIQLYNKVDFSKSLNNTVYHHHVAKIRGVWNLPAAICEQVSGACHSNLVDKDPS